MNIAAWRDLQLRMMQLERLAQEADMQGDDEANSPQFRRKQRYRAQRLRADIYELIKQAGGIQLELFQQASVQIDLEKIRDSVRRKFKAPIAQARKRQRPGGGTSP